MRRLVGRFETKLVLTSLVIIGAVVGGVGLWVARPLKAVAREQIARGLEGQARLMAAQVDHQ